MPANVNRMEMLQIRNYDITLISQNAAQWRLIYLVAPAKVS